MGGDALSGSDALTALLDEFIALQPVMQALVAATGTWLLTALGASTVLLIRTTPRQLLDGMLGFAAGAMLYVVVEELIPDAARAGNIDIATIGFAVGFTVMMVLDNAVG